MALCLCYSCSKTDLSVEADMFCGDCKQGLCSKCLNLHNGNPDNATHRIVEVGSIRGCVFAANKLDPFIQEKSNIAMPRSFKLIGKISCKKTPSVYISSLAVTKDNRILLCNARSDLLLVYDENGECSAECTLVGKPWDIALTQNGRKAVVTLDLDCAIQFLEVLPEVKPAKYLRLPWKCYGVVIVKTYVCLGGRGKIHILNNSGQHLFDIDIKHNGYIWYLHPGPDETIYCTLYDFDIISCLQLNGNIIFECQNKAFRGPEEIAVDKGGNLYVACRESNTINRLLPSGQLKDIILDEQDGIKKPYGIAFNADFTKLFVSNKDGETVFIFSCSY